MLYNVLTNNILINHAIVPMVCSVLEINRPWIRLCVLAVVAKRIGIV